MELNKIPKLSLLLLRLTVGWMFFYAGITKVLNDGWSAGGYLAGAKNFTGFYQWLASPAILPITNFLNEWGLTLLGVALILGVFVRICSLLGALMMLLYYLVILEFPYPNAHAYIVDEHIIYIAILLFFATTQAGRFYGFDRWRRNLN
ncbi:MAG: DoxX family protein [Patescibacteria group bacterium]